MLNRVQQNSSSINQHEPSMKTKKTNPFVSALFTVAVVFFVFSFGYRLGEYRSLKETPFDKFIPAANQEFSKSSAPSSSNKNVLENNDKDVDFGIFWEAWDIFDKNFIDRAKLDSNKMFYNAVKGMVSSSEDPYTFFLTPEENKDSKDSLNGTFEGIGAQLGTKDNRIVVISPIKNSPAIKAGVKAGDIIVAVDGNSIKGKTITQVVTIIRGPSGTKVKLTIERNSKEQIIEITRGEIKVESIETVYKDKIAHVKLQQFGTSVREEWQKTALDLAEKYRKNEIKGMILDMRGNPGGLLNACVYIASDFLPLGSLVVKQEGLKESIEYNVTRAPLLPKIPVVVLIDKGSASASEILAGALRDYKRATLVGEKSFGKGSVQGTYDLSDGSGMHVTVAKWILPKGDWIMGKGIEPDVKVENPEADIENTVDNEKNDKQLQKAEELLK